ncbi:hypothetical protein PR048_018797 [Dryococelus australis]|uniref:Uncharacterized protein n=1 Tax=Dryococelus australis TaxID=614101 RepID=A0ABQ9H1N6_9NEOP|nr:hypothetical protein PR048_018797 [Dryococelus australis]
MPRMYQQNSPQPTYTVDNVIQDVKDVKYGVPKTITQERVTGKVTVDTFGNGRHKSLSDKEELDIKACILAHVHFEYPCDRHELLDLGSMFKQIT